MAKGKKTVIKTIKRIDDKIISINDKEYILLEKCDDVESAITMKISSNGNRILRFEDEKKMIKIDVKREIEIVKYTIVNAERAKKFNKGYNKTILTNEDGRKVIDTAYSYSNAKEIIASYYDKKSPNYDSIAGKSTFYLSEEI